MKEASSDTGHRKTDELGEKRESSTLTRVIYFFPFQLIQKDRFLP